LGYFISDYNYLFLTLQKTKDMKQEAKEFKVGDTVSTKNGNGVVVGITADGGAVPYLVKIKWFDGHNGSSTPLIKGSNETLNDDGYWFSAKDLSLTQANQKEVVTYSVTRESLKEIYDNVCGEWQVNIRALLYNDMFSNTIEISQELLERAYKEPSSEVQKEWLAKYLPKPKVKKVVEVSRWANIYEYKTYYYDTKNDAEASANLNKIIACVMLTGSYSIYE
jgi:uncharacterized protein YodC (DUF2158 family)